MTDFTANPSNVEVIEPSVIVRKRLVEFLRQYAADNGVTQDELAHRTGLHPSNINRLLSGRYSPSIDIFLRITDALRLRVDLVDK